MRHRLSSAPFLLSRPLFPSVRKTARAFASRSRFRAFGECTRVHVRVRTIAGMCAPSARMHTRALSITRDDHSKPHLSRPLPPPRVPLTRRSYRSASLIFHFGEIAFNSGATPPAFCPTLCRPLHRDVYASRPLLSDRVVDGGSLTKFQSSPCAMRNYRGMIVEIC